MGIGYEPAKEDDEVHDLIREMVSLHHQELDEAEVTVGVLFAFSPVKATGEPSGPSVKLHGVPCAAVVKINSTKARAEGLPDATITIDGHLWNGTGEGKEMHHLRKLALLDHELQHLELVRTKDGDVASDDRGRPKLKMRPHDFEVGWFRSVAERHGVFSFEVRQAAVLVDADGQLLMPWASRLEPSPARKTADSRSDWKVSVVVDGKESPSVPFDKFVSAVPAKA